MTQTSVVITGATRGLGEALAIGCAKMGHFVVGVSRNVPTTDFWYGMERDNRGVHVAGDVADAATAAHAIRAAIDQRQLTLLINCAGIGAFADPGSYSPESVTGVIESNLIGMIRFCEAAISPLMVSRGTIVNIMSTAAFASRAREAVYCAAKWGARGYTETLRQELKSAGVRVVAVYPGGMNTTFWDDSGASPDRAKFMPPGDVAALILAQLGAVAAGYVSDLTINRG